MIRGDGNGRYIKEATVEEIHEGVAANFLSWATIPEISYEVYWGGGPKGAEKPLIARKAKGADLPEVLDPLLLAEFISKAD